VEVIPATVADIPELYGLAARFYAESNLLGTFDAEMFRANWERILRENVGAIFLLKSGNWLAGALGGVVYPDMYQDRLVATEFFWFVKPESRGSGLRLYDAFEKWAKERGCQQIRMVHLLDVMPERVSQIYLRLGFTPAEVHYIKEIK
jgi:GNAT superfamily N-acetyltransferase